MIIKLNMTSEIPIYVQLRNEIVLGIGRGELKAGEQLPTVRQMAADIYVYFKLPDTYNLEIRLV